MTWMTLAATMMPSLRRAEALLNSHYLIRRRHYLDSPQVPPLMLTRSPRSPARAKRGTKITITMVVMQVKTLTM